MINGKPRFICLKISVVVWVKILNNTTAVPNRALQLQRHGNFDLFFGLNLAKKLYKMTDNLSRTLHGKAKALNVIKTLKSMRNKVSCGKPSLTIKGPSKGGVFEISDVPGRGEGWFVKIRTSENC